MTTCVSCFRQLQAAQRARPESMFLPAHNPGADISGAFQWAMEHTGDLVHRAAYQPEMGGYGCHAMVEKLTKLMRWRRAGDSVQDQATRNHEFETAEGRVSQPLRGYLAALDQAGLRYAEAYMQLGRLRASEPCAHRLVQTWLQRQAVLAAVALGCQSWARYDRVLNKLHQALTGAESDVIITTLYYGEKT